ncbi:Calcineurin-like metallo-phosphoesterase superfamily protein [Quillaja saponaria]|uniref:Calcineurin-like metallo-phosphoesterase superfamily protein n=1 Tax=Quillaja saponaria TaxID=32244 RepID=A0AAD7LCI9_QUISA|nr:Calcineurin-like metallo-phosphoesterase superfamily protein [Quillaja saponaria]
MEKTSWVCTIITQLSLCCALYVAVNLGQPQKVVYRQRSENTPLDIYFISVKGGFRPLEQQKNLLKQMEKVAQTYKARFVINSSELGDDDPLASNATRHFSLLKVPWHTTRTLKGHGVGCFQEKIKTPIGITLDIIGVDTELLQDSVPTSSLSSNKKSQLQWLIKTLEASTSNWRIVVGYHPLVVCGENEERMQAKQNFEYLHRVFRRFEVNVYLSGQDCTTHNRSVAYIGNPGLAKKKLYSISQDRKSVFNGELVNGFLLHRVSSLQIVTYFITSDGEVAYRTVLQQKGREVM